MVNKGGESFGVLRFCIVGPVLLQSGNKLLDALHVNYWEIYGFQDIEVGIIGDNQFRIAADGAIYELIVIGVRLDQMEEKSRFYLDKVRSVY